MPKANWGIESSDVDDFDRDTVYTPYTGPIPPDAVYLFQIKKLQHIAGSKSKLPQLRVGLELVSRDDDDFDDEKYEGYFIMDFLHISDKTKFRYVPFLDAIGVSGRDFTRRTVMKEDGTITRIGQWAMSDEEYVFAQIVTGEDQNGSPRKEVKVYMPYEDEAEDDEDDDYYDEEDPV